MNYQPRKRMISLLLAFALLLTMAPSEAFKIFAVTMDSQQTVVEAPEISTETLQTQVGKQAIFDWWSDFLLAPQALFDSYNAAAMTQLYDGDEQWFGYDEIGADGLVVKIEDVLHDEVNGFIWYKLGPRNGETLPDVLQANPWVLYCLDTDLEEGIAPYLAVYGSDETVMFVSSSYVVSGEEIVTTFVVSGPAALSGATVEITYNALPDYEVSALSLDYGDAEPWYLAFDVAVSGGSWTAADGPVGIRYLIADFGSNTFENSNYGGAFMYVNGTVCSAAVSDFWSGSVVSDMIYTNAANATVVFELLNESFAAESGIGRIQDPPALLYDISLASPKQYYLSDLPEEFAILYSFTTTDEGGVSTEWYWIVSEELPDRQYFLVEAANVARVYNGEVLDDAPLAYTYLMDAGTLTEFEEVWACIPDAVAAELQAGELWEEIVLWKNLLVYDSFYTVSTEDAFNAIAEAYPDAFAYIQANEELKYYNDYILYRLRNMDLFAPPPAVELGELVFPKTESNVNVGQVVPASTTTTPPVSTMAYTRMSTPMGIYRSFAGSAIYSPMTTFGVTGLADGEPDDGIELNKTVTGPDENGHYTIRLEAYTTGAEITIVQEQQIPVDIVFILDLSQSMSGTFSSSAYYGIIRGTAQEVHTEYKDVLYVKDGSTYCGVSIKTGGSTTTKDVHTEYTNDTVSELYQDRNTPLYYYANGDYHKITVTRSGKKNNYTYTVTYEGETEPIIQAVSGQTSLSGYTFYTKTTQTAYETYTYTYENASGVEVSYTYAADESVVGGDNPEYYVAVTNVSRMDALVNAVENFSYQVGEEAKGADGVLGTPDDVAHRIAIVGFNGYTKAGSAVYIDGKNYPYNYSGATEGNRAEDVYATAYQDVSKAGELDGVLDSINSLIQATNTDLHAGTAMAVEILKANASNEDYPYTDDEGNTIRNKVVIVFTDGVPTYQGEGKNSDIPDEGYNDPITDASAMKNTYGATVYTVGILDDGDNTLPAPSLVDGSSTYDNDKLNRYMHYMSSNYKAATSIYADATLTNTDYETNGNYYLLAKDANELNNIFTSIQQAATSGGTTATLSLTTKIVDVISPYFTLPDNATVDDIKVYTSEYGEDGFAAPVLFEDATVTMENNSIYVSNFDYQEHWVGTETNNGVATHRGKKLIIEIPIEMIDSFLGGNAVPTNSATSGIYNGDTLMASFPVPDTDIPMPNIRYQDTTRHIYYGNTINLAGILDNLLKQMGFTEEQYESLNNAADGHNNYFVNMEFVVTTSAGDAGPQYVYSLPRGAKWAEGTWVEIVTDANGNTQEKPVEMDKLLLSGDEAYTVHLAMEYADVNMLQILVETAKNLTQGNYTAATWGNAATEGTFAKALANATNSLSLDLVERAHASTQLYETIAKLELATSTDNDSVDQLQKTIYLATALKTGLGSIANPPDTLQLNSALAKANTALSAYQTSPTPANAAAAASAADVLSVAIENMVKMPAAHGLATIYVHKPVLTFKDSLQDYLEDLYFYNDDSFAVVRAAVENVRSVLSDGTADIYTAMESLMPASSYGDAPLDALRKSVLQVNSLKSGVYSDTTYNAAQQSIVNVDSALAKATQDLTFQISNLTLVSGTNDTETDGLRKKILIAEGLKPSNYTVESFEALEAALTAARTVLNAADATDQQKSDATGALETAINALVLSKASGHANLDALQKVILQAEGLVEINYTGVSYKAVEDKVEEVYTDLNALANNIQMTVSNLELADSYGYDSVDALWLAMQLAGGLSQSNYSAGSYAALSTALSNVPTALAGKDEAISDAIDALALVVQYSAANEGAELLTKAILEAEKLKEVNYTSATFTPLSQELAEAKAMLANTSATDAQKSAQANDLCDEISKLELVSKTGEDNVDNLLRQLLFAEGLYALNYPDRLALLQSHLFAVNWIHTDASNNQTDSTAVTMSGTAPTLKLNFFYPDTADGKNPFADGRMSTQSDVPVSVTVQLLGKNADGTAAESKSLTRNDTDLITFLHLCDRPAAMCHFNAATEEFVLHVRTPALIIQVMGLPTGCTDNTLFMISNSKGEKMYVTIQGNGIAVLLGNMEFEEEFYNQTYTVTQLTDWSWKYDFVSVYNATDSVAQVTSLGAGVPAIQVKLIEDADGGVNHIVFVNSYNNPDWLSDEDETDNDFGKYTP